ncbi:hypothetical protein MJ561_13815 [Klebsiella pneumoniae]|nr:hypothetical protein MJ561_13815 [Klebsiella pneumoniae]
MLDLMALSLELKEETDRPGVRIHLPFSLTVTGPPTALCAWRQQETCEWGGR